MTATTIFRDRTSRASVPRWLVIHKTHYGFRHTQAKAMDIAEAIERFEAQGLVTPGLFEPVTDDYARPNPDKETAS